MPNSSHPKPSNLILIIAMQYFLAPIALSLLNKILENVTMRKMTNEGGPMDSDRKKH